MWKAEALNRQRLFSASSQTGEALEKLLALNELPDGWHFGAGHAPTLKQIADALTVSSILQTAGAEQVDVFPDPEGGILVIGYNGDDSIEILCGADGWFDFAAEINGFEIPRIDRLSLAALGLLVGVYAWQRPTSSSDYYTHGILTVGSPDMYVSPFETLPEPGVYRLSMLYAPVEMESSAPILPNTTLRSSPEIPQFSGDYLPGFFREARV